MSPAPAGRFRQTPPQARALMIRHLIASPYLRVALVIVAVGCFALPCSGGSTELNAAVSSCESSLSTTVKSSSESGGPFLISGRGMAMLLAIGGAAAITRTIDKDECLGNKIDGSMFDPVVDAGDVFVNGLTAGAGVLGLYAVGGLSGDQRFGAAGGDLAKSLVLTWGSVWTLKVLVDSDRPSGGDFVFPSGHTATAFATAPVLTRYFGWKVGVPAYTLATATALARLEERKHCLADVLVGAALGLVIGSEVASKGGFGVIREHVVVCGRGMGVKVRF